MKLSKQQIAHQFSRAAATYDEVAQLQQTMADRLIEQIPCEAVGTLIDLGCGTGYALAEIGRRTRLKRIGFDLAPGMIEICRRRLKFPASVQFVLGDLERTGLAGEIADIVFSNAAFQWCDSPTAFGEAARILKPKGLLLASTFGPQTLHQWKTAWQSIGDEQPRVHEFESVVDLKQSLIKAGFQNIRIETQLFDLKFDNVAAMFRSIKKLGATNAAQNRSQGFLGRAKYSSLVNHFETERKNVGHLTLTFECLYIDGSKPG